MATWNYRIILHDSDPHPYYALHEVYYREDKSVIGWTENPKRFLVDAREGAESIGEDLDMASKALSRPVLKLSELEAELAARATAET